jgi:peroxiredoxin
LKIDAGWLRARPTRIAAAGAAAIVALALIVLALIDGRDGSFAGTRKNAPDVVYTLLDGQRTSIAGLRGKVVLVNFWATDCAACLHEMPQIAATHARYRRRGYETLAVSMRHDAPASVIAYAQSRGLPFGVAIDNTGEIAARFGNVLLTPTSVLLDKRGRIAERYLGEPDFSALARRIEALLAEA